MSLTRSIISLSSHLDGDGLLRDAVAAPNTKGAGADRGSDAKQVWAEVSGGSGVGRSLHCTCLLGTLMKP